jgi:hypothetical protein
VGVWGVCQSSGFVCLPRRLLGRGGEHGTRNLEHTVGFGCGGGDLEPQPPGVFCEVSQLASPAPGPCPTAWGMGSSLGQCEGLRLALPRVWGRGLLGQPPLRVSLCDSLCPPG